MGNSSDKEKKKKGENKEAPILDIHLQIYPEEQQQQQ